MSNYLAILGNPEMRRNFEPAVIAAMEKAVAIYTATTSKAYIEEYMRQKKSQEKEEEVSSLLR